MSKRLRSAGIAMLAAVILVLGVAQPSYANTWNGGSLGCPPGSQVRISWTTTGTPGVRPYYNTTNGWVPGPWYAGNNGSWNTGTRTVTGWQVFSASGTVTAAGASCV